MQNPIAKLEMHLEMYENNARVQKAEGRTKEAKESAANAKAIRFALTVVR